MRKTNFFAFASFKLSLTVIFKQENYTKSKELSGTLLFIGLYYLLFSFFYFLLALNFRFSTFISRKYYIKWEKLGKNAFNMSDSLYVASLVDTSTVTPDEKWKLLFDVNCPLNISIDDFNENWWPLVSNIWTQ